MLFCFLIICFIYFDLRLSGDVNGSEEEGEESEDDDDEEYAEQSSSVRTPQLFAFELASFHFSEFFHFALFWRFWGRSLSFFPPFSKDWGINNLLDLFNPFFPTFCKSIFRNAGRRQGVQRRGLGLGRKQRRRQRQRLLFR